MSQAQTAFARLFDAYTERYLKQMRGRGYAASTTQRAATILRDLRAFLLSEALPRPKNLGDVTAQHVAAFRDHEIARPKKTGQPGALSAASIGHVIAALRGLFGGQVRRRLAAGS